ncbi:hypothetical protein I4F81_010802 [Pyropia yezoensis]|uniref:Uncharacterized protein n=1 Tax=Pyropia yezoensis TaxID=2788 RepID=A0ACC3CE13_PYRYE|nr:hypothetical protein I4F81_010802 [Neopyropia yezoensis]
MFLIVILSAARVVGMGEASKRAGRGGGGGGRGGWVGGGGGGGEHARALPPLTYQRQTAAQVKRRAPPRRAPPVRAATRPAGSRGHGGRPLATTQVEAGTDAAPPRRGLAPPAPPHTKVLHAAAAAAPPLPPAPPPRTKRKWAWGGGGAGGGGGGATPPVPSPVDHHWVPAGAPSILPTDRPANTAAAWGGGGARRANGGPQWPAATRRRGQRRPAGRGRRRRGWCRAACGRPGSNGGGGWEGGGGGGARWGGCRGEPPCRQSRHRRRRRRPVPAVAGAARVAAQTGERPSMGAAVETRPPSCFIAATIIRNGEVWGGGGVPTAQPHRHAPNTPPGKDRESAAVCPPAVPLPVTVTRLWAVGGGRAHSTSHTPVSTPTAAARPHAQRPTGQRGH